MRGVSWKRSRGVKRICQVPARAARRAEAALRRRVEVKKAAAVTAISRSSKRSGGITLYFVPVVAPPLAGAGVPVAGAAGGVPGLGAASPLGVESAGLPEPPGMSYLIP